MSPCRYRKTTEIMSPPAAGSSLKLKQCWAHLVWPFLASPLAKGERTKVRGWSLTTVRLSLVNPHPTHIPHSTRLTIRQQYRATAPILICKEKIDNEIVCRRAAPDFPAPFPFQCLSICQKQLQKWADRSFGSSRFFW
jgi:hypothetical protein